MRRTPAIMALGASLFVTSMFPAAMAATDGRPEQPKTIVFVCLHGSVKSQMAAAHFNRIAGERGLPFTAISRGIEVDNSIPTRIRDGLNLDGLAPIDDIPVGLTAEEANRATMVVAFDAVPDDREVADDDVAAVDLQPAAHDRDATGRGLACDRDIGRGFLDRAG